MRIVANDVTYRYPGSSHAVLTGVSFTVEAGTSVAIIGPSGSGKTTLLSVLGGLLPLRHGSVAAVDAQGRNSPVRPSAAWVLQTVSLLPDRSARDNVMVGSFCAGMGVSAAATHADRHLSMVGLAERADAPARTLSGGESQRVAIARALSANRPIILADEPTEQLDHRTSTSVIDAMLAAGAERTVVIVTHDAEVAAQCDSVLELRDGVLHSHTRSRAT